MLAMGIAHVVYQNAILKTETPLRLFENISLCIENAVFCKVLRADAQGVLLGFTAGHKDFCAKVMGEMPAESAYEQ
jgi:hypothetical protein